MGSVAAPRVHACAGACACSAASTVQPPPPCSPYTRRGCRRPNVVLQIKNYSLPTPSEGRQRARSDVPFMFKAFETGQAPPPRPGTKKAEVGGGDAWRAGGWQCVATH